MGECRMDSSDSEQEQSSWELDNEYKKKKKYRLLLD
jgi:hypothetical protein